MRALCLLVVFASTLYAGCAAPARVDVDGWGVQRRLTGRTPALLSISHVNAGSPTATDAIAQVPVRTRTRGRHQVTVTSEASLSATWTPGAALFDPLLDRALDRLAWLGAADPRGIDVRLTLVADHGARVQESLHPADDTVVIDLLIPVPTHPRSRGAALEAALATGLHEAAHALRPALAKDRDDDEYRASLVAACFRIDSAQRGDVMNFKAPAPTPRADADFTLAHSAAASLAVQRDLAQALGASSLAGGNSVGIASLQAFCSERLAQPPR